MNLNVPGPGRHTKHGPRAAKALEALKKIGDAIGRPTIGEKGCLQVSVGGGAL